MHDRPRGRMHPPFPPPPAPRLALRRPVRAWVPIVDSPFPKQEDCLCPTLTPVVQPSPPPPLVPKHPTPSTRAAVGINHIQAERIFPPNKVNQTINTDSCPQAPKREEKPKCSNPYKSIKLLRHLDVRGVSRKTRHSTSPGTLPLTLQPPPVLCDTYQGTVVAVLSFPVTSYGAGSVCAPCVQVSR